MSCVPRTRWGPLLIAAPLACLRARESAAGAGQSRGGFAMPRRPHCRSLPMRAALAALLLVTAAPVMAQTPANFTRATPAPKIDTIPPARDVRFPGTIRLHVDATDI